MIYIWRSNPYDPEKLQGELQKIKCRGMKILSINQFFCVLKATEEPLTYTISYKTEETKGAGTTAKRKGWGFTLLEQTALRTLPHYQNAVPAAYYENLRQLCRSYGYGLFGSTAGLFSALCGWLQMNVFDILLGIALAAMLPLYVLQIYRFVQLRHALAGYEHVEHRGRFSVLPKE